MTKLLCVRQLQPDRTLGMPILPRGYRGHKWRTASFSSISAPPRCGVYLKIVIHIEITLSYCKAIRYLNDGLCNNSSSVAGVLKTITSRDSRARSSGGTRYHRLRTHFKHFSRKCHCFLDDKSSPPTSDRWRCRRRPPVAFPSSTEARAKDSVTSLRGSAAAFLLIYGTSQKEEDGVTGDLTASQLGTVLVTGGGKDAVG
ncbi:unnamed protein product [Larinioides sclopetarius]|uniref:Uncharacterized protein n=1 Tax=Larinioides sclopetarius TaxID=280406 RepID=A0AAV2A3J3_9ARAC